MEPVHASAEITRILAIPRREWQPEHTDRIVAEMTAALRSPSGTMTLLPHQAIALAELSVYRGVFAPLPVGAGKTLISFLAARVVPAEDAIRPLLITKASLIPKAEREELELRKHWVLPVRIAKISYETLSRVGSARFLEDYCPTIVIADEGHCVRYAEGSASRRFWRYLTGQPRATSDGSTEALDPAEQARRRAIPLVYLTGSPVDRSIRDLRIAMHRTLGNRAPVPRDHHEIEAWAMALDVDVPDAKRRDPGALRQFCAPGEEVHEAIQRRIRETPGVVSIRAASVDTPITIASHTAPICDRQEEAIARLRREGVTPDEEAAEDAIAIWRHVREISLGFFSKYDPPPPREWKEARSNWHRTCAAIVSDNRRAIDSAEQLVRHMQAHPDHYPEALNLYRIWKEIEPSYAVEPRAEWISDATIEWVRKWAKAHTSGLIWIDRPAVGRRLADVIGIPYYGQEGLDDRGRYIGDASGVVIVSSGAGQTGHNLQQFTHNLALDVPRSPVQWEQRIGRTHRPGQRSAVHVDVLFGCHEDARAFWSAVEHATNIFRLTGSPQKLQLADLTAVEEIAEIEARKGARWMRTGSKPKDQRS